MKTILDNLKEYYKNNSEEQIIEDWKKSKKYDDVNSPTVDQFMLCNVCCSLPSEEEIHIEAEKHQDKHTNDPLALTYDAFVAGCNYVIKKQKQKSN